MIDVRREPDLIEPDGSRCWWNGDQPGDPLLIVRAVDGKRFVFFTDKERDLVLRARRGRLLKIVRRIQERTESA